MEINEAIAYKLEYNKVLKRYFKGCNYLQEHPEETDKYIPEVLKLKTKLDDLLTKIVEVQGTVTSTEILSGFGDIEEKE